ncbi:hypothetical protein FIBSPDRAFT_913544 [Athelia psychrophila]|uniref:Uncharacterized protein n=1 Tax=Athelia psychrophila TaxID=1759441 RepID=A0A166AJ09_9AGAM|nr:hypothetical protein FIBSPDRAFT_913544 [Fibularhizoctonia sp. CBS 109695]
MRPEDWVNPRLNFVYSQGPPVGRTTLGEHVFCKLLVDEDGEQVPCRESHATSDREALKQRLRESRRESSATRALFEKTLSLYRSYLVLGCLGPASDHPPPSDIEDREDFAWLVQMQKIRRGHHPEVTCSGRILLEHDYTGQAFIRCEHFSTKLGGTRDHLFSYNISNGLYDLDYLKALFSDDDDAIEEFELAAQTDGFGPLVECSTIANFSTIKVNCPCEHRNNDGELLLAEMVRLPCRSTFRCYEPIEEYRKACPRVLVVCRGEHTHPIPLPTKTPPSIRAELFAILQSLDVDLADIMPRRLLRHTLTQAYLQKRLPNVPRPMLADLHVSLANRQHIKSYITQVQNRCFPHGTGWKDEDEAESPYTDSPVEGADGREVVRLIVCMTPSSSERLARARYLQSDIVFKRIAGFLEFEIGGLDESSNLAVSYCRVYLNRQNAAAHALVFAKVEEIVLEDTGQSLNSPDELCGILQWAGDQHGGQAKGLGLHLQSLAARMPLGRRDLHEVNRTLASLTPYDHLRRLFRLCIVHFYRNINAATVTDSVKKKMRSLVCITHRDFEGCLREIALEGGKAGADWANDKICSKFALAAICWERSLIPKLVWQTADSTTNIIESLHFDVNQEGKSCTLVGGVRKGQHFDKMKLQTLEAFELTGVHPSYKTGHTSDNILSRLEKNNDSKANDRMLSTQTRAAVDPANETGRMDLAKATRGKGSTDDRYAKALETSVSTIGKGSGRALLLLPTQVVAQGQPSG